MESFSTWEALLVGLLCLMLIFWRGRGIKAILEQSRNAKSDWIGLLMPIGFVVLFVIFLAIMV